MHRLRFDSKKDTWLFLVSFSVWTKKTCIINSLVKYSLCVGTRPKWVVLALLNEVVFRNRSSGHWYLNAMFTSYQCYMCPRAESHVKRLMMSMRDSEWQVEWEAVRVLLHEKTKYLQHWQISQRFRKGRETVGKWETKNRPCQCRHTVPWDDSYVPWESWE